MSAECLFCRIRDGKIPSTRLYEDDDVIAFADVNPQAPSHVLVIPRRHIATLNDLVASDDPLTGKIVRVATQVAAERGLAERGYRLVANCMEEAGQSVFHLHVHVLGGRRMSWPPG